MKFFEKIINNTKLFLESNWGVVAICSLATLFWCFNLPVVAVAVLAMGVIVCFLTCDDIKLLFGPFMLVPFFSVDVQNPTELTTYAIVFGFVFTSFIFYIVKHRKMPVRKGNMFWGLMIADIAFLLGGIIGHFDIKTFFIILALNVAMYLVYFVAINYTKNLIPYLMLCFIVVAMCLVVQFGLLLVRSGDILDCILSRGVQSIGDVSINVAALYYPLGVIGGIYLAKKSEKYKYIHLILSAIMFVFMLLTYCRGVIVTSSLVILALCIWLIAKSPKRKALSITFGSVLVGVGILTFAIPTLREIVIGFISRGLSTSGRDKLWEWCIEQFRSSPIFGIGFVVSEPPPSLTLNIVMAHNTVLQWFTSLGIVGTVLMIPFYYQKYKTFFGKYNFNKLCCLCCVLCIALEGILNPACFIVFFVVAMSLVIVGAVENENNNLATNNK